ncbi:MAG TPA: NIPSNAP family protein [Anaerolinea sp.]|nr:NIPSNAP family protein [Anaerolinea sp.]
MVILERDVQHIYPDKWDELNKIDGEFNLVESGFGFPEKKRFQLLIGADEANTLIVEWQWPSMSSMEAAYEKAMADPAWQALVAKSNEMIRDHRYEVYLVLS